MSNQMVFQNLKFIREAIYGQIVALNQLLFERYQKELVILISMKVLIIINECQQLELSNNLDQNYIILEILHKYGVYFLFGQEKASEEIALIIISALLIVALIMITFLFSQNVVKNTPICQYILIFNHFIILLPVMYMGIHNIQNQAQTLVTLIIALIIEYLHIFLNTKFAFVEIEGSFSNILFNILQLFVNLIFCVILEIYSGHKFIIRMFQIIMKSFYCFLIIDSQDKIVKFQLKLQTILILQIILNELKLDWCLIVVFFLLGQNLIISIRKNVTLLQLLKDNKISLIKLQILSRIRYKKQKNKILEILISSHMPLETNNYKIILQCLKTFIQKIQFINYLEDHNSIKGLQILIETNFETINFLEQIKLIALKERFRKKCEKENVQHQDIKLCTQSLLLESKLNKILESIAQEKIKFLVQLQRDSEEEQYSHQITNGLKKMSYTLLRLKNELESHFNLSELRLSQYCKSDIITLKLLSRYYYIFYLDFEKAQKIKSKMCELILWNKLLNAKIEENQLLVIQISYVKQFGKIVNLNESRFKLAFPQQKLVPTNLMDMIPVFWQDCYRKNLSDFLEGNFHTPTNGVFLFNNFIQPCHIHFSYTILEDDIIINQFIQIDKCQKDVLYFNSDGKILGISQEIFEHLMIKSENQFTQSLKIKDFIDISLIQFYISDIYQQVVAFQALALQNQFVQRVRCQWKFPLNHQKCLLAVKNFFADDSSIKHSKSVSHFIYSHSTKRMFNNFKSKVTLVQGTDPQILNISIKMIKPSFNDQLSKTVISTKSRSIEMEYDLHFLKTQLPDGQWLGLFKIEFLEVEEMKSAPTQEQFIQQVLNKLGDLQEPLETNQQENALTNEDLLIKNGIYKHIKISFFLLIIILLLLLIISYLNTYINQNDLVVFEYYYNYAIFPQAFTFEYAAIVLNEWNRFCALNKVYSISQLVENARLGALEFQNGVMLGRYHTDAMGCYLLSLELGLDNVTLIQYSDTKKQETVVNYYQFFEITRTQMDEMHRNNLVNYGTVLEDYSLINSTNLIRQNVVKIFTFCDIALDALVQKVLDNITNSTTTYNTMLITQCIIVLIIVLFQSRIIFVSQQTKTKLFKLLTFIPNDTVSEIMINLNQINHYHTTSIIQNNISITNNTQPEKLLVTKPKKQTTHKLLNHRYKSWTVIILPASYFLIFLILSITASLLHLHYYDQYEKSLKMTFKFVKLKKIFDGSVLLGELIKTEYLIDPESVNFINQTEIITQFFNYTDQLLPLISSIIDDFTQSDIFDSATYDMISKALQGNLCDDFPTFYHFCSISDTSTEYSSKDITYNYLSQGVNGMMQNYQSLLLSEFSFERSYLKYQTNKTLLNDYLNTQLHQNIFVQYFYDMEYLVYTSFSLFYDQTLYLGQKITERLNIFFIVSSVISLTVLLIEFIVWGVLENDELNRLRLIVTLLPPSLLANKSLNQLLQRLLRDIY